MTTVSHPETPPSPVRPGSPAYSRGTLVLLSLVLIVAAVPRLYELDSVNYWFDESFTLKMAEFGPVELLSRVVHDDDNPPLYYFALIFWNTCVVPLGVPQRGLSALCGLVAVAGVFFAVLEAFKLGSLVDSRGEREKRLFGATLAGLLVGLSPLQISWSTQVRMYSLMTALSAVSSALLLRALRPASTRRDWMLFTIVSSLQLYTHYFGLFILAAQFLFAMLYAWRVNHRSDAGGLHHPAMTSVLFSALGVYVLFVPWQVPFLEHRTRVDVSFPAPALTWESAGTTLCRSFDLQLAWPATGINGFFVAQAMIFATAGLVATRRPGLMFLGLAGLLPFLATAFVSLGMRNIFVPRYMMSGQMLLLAGLGTLVAFVPTRWGRGLVGIALVCGTAWLTREHCLVRQVDARLPGMRQAMRHLDEHRQPGEPVVVVNPMLFTTLVQYTRSRPGIYVSGEPRNYPFYQGTAAMRDDEYVSRSQMAEYQGDRLWSVDADEWFGHAWTTDIPPGWKEAGRTRFRDFYAEIVIRRYERNKAE